MRQADLDRIVALVSDALGPAEGEPVELTAGLTNRNLKMRFGGADYVLRLCGEETEVLGIDRGAEWAATQAAHEAGVAPEPVLYLPDEQALVTRFVAASSRRCWSDMSGNCYYRRRHEATSVLT